MADFAPPTGPPPPKVPEGWKAIYNEQYQEWFYVNIYTKKSQWDKPTEPIYPPQGHDGPPAGPPPVYNNDSARPLQSEKTGGSTGNQMFGTGGAGAGHNLTADEELARKLQAEEDARARGSSATTAHRGEADTYYGQGQGQGGAPQYGQQPAYGGAQGYDQQQPQHAQQSSSKGGGILGKLLGKGKSSSSQQQGYSQQQMYGQPGYGQPAYAQHGYGGYPPQQQQYAQPGRRPGGGMGMAGGAALGLGGGLLGGMLLADGMEHMGDGGDGGGDGGGDYGGGDGGGDYGGGDGGGDFGGGDGGGDFGGGD